MNYTLHQLQVFVQVTESKSVTKAAEVLNLTQPAVSIQLKNFQDQFDIALTEVVGRKLYVTDFGKEIAVVAQEILIQAQQIQDKTLAYKGFLTGKINISVVSTGKYVIPYFLQAFMQKHPGIDVSIDVTNKASVLNNLTANNTDFSLVSILPERIAVEQLELIQNKLYLVASPTSATKLPSKKIQSLLEQSTLIYREQGSGTRQTMERFLQQMAIPVRKKMELTSNEAVKQAVLAGLGVSIMPLIGIKNELQLQQLQIIPVKGLPIQTSWHLVWPQGKKHSPASHALLQYLQMHKDDIINTHFNWYENY
ncbi:MAG: LysR family transcriptional regulator [Saprospiraceae bacterium]